ncbi:MAG: transcriptional repressor [Clostridiales bacterium]|jgi:Fur family ferric uptake transcriptional regulator|nr:transcriptional repressor [Clostridiales bacterium]
MKDIGIYDIFENESVLFAIYSQFGYNYTMEQKHCQLNCERFATIKNTKPRLAVHGVLLNAKMPLSAKEIFAQLSGTSDIWLSSVYRALEIFEKNNIVSRSVLLSGEAVYELITSEHNHYAICTECHGKTKIDTCPISNFELNGFAPTSHKLEIYGVCVNCQKKK